MQSKKQTMKSNYTSTVSTVINAPATKVWDALTNPEMIKKYFFGTQAISNWQEGSPLIFKGEWDGKTYEDKGTILKVDAPKLFKYNYWSSISGIEDKAENYVDITYRLTQSDDQTMLTVIQENIPDEKRKEHSEQNWKKVLDDLTKLVEQGDAANRAQ
jgi:uncharacterized protein YndB with AHSA1/START domain